MLVGGKAVALASSSQHLTQIALSQQTATVVLPAHRGAILDRNGRELAVGKPAKTVFATPYLLDDPRAAAKQLWRVLHIRRHRDRLALRKAFENKKSGFAYVARKVDPALAKAALALDIPGVGAYDEEERAYPMKGSAGQVLGLRRASTATGSRASRRSTTRSSPERPGARPSCAIRRGAR